MNDQAEKAYDGGAASPAAAAAVSARRRVFGNLAVRSAACLKIVHVLLNGSGARWTREAVWLCLRHRA